MAATATAKASEKAKSGEAAEKKAAKVSLAPVSLRDRYEILPDKPIPDLDMPSAKAFEVQDRRGAGRALYGLVCRPDTLQRHLVMRSLRGMQNAGMLQFIEGGVVDWTPAGRKLVSVVYERPVGGKIMPDLNGTCDVVPDTLFAKKIIKPLHAALQELQTRAVTHRAIRPDNIYLFDTKGDRLVLGDCVSAAPGLDNNPIFEPVEMALCNPEGRGAGHYSDDMFSLGVTLLFLMVGHNPTRGKTPEEVMRMRLQQGTYATYVGENRIPLAMIEVLRGLLHDDSRERWTLDQLDLWLNGRRMTPLQPRMEKRSQRTLKIGDTEYSSARGAAYGLMMNWSKGGTLIQEGKLEVWLRRGLEDNEKADAVATAMKVVEAGQSDKTVMTDLIVSRTIMILYPDAPLCFRNVRCTLDGFGSALGHAVLRKGDVKPFAEIIARDVVKLWVQAQPVYNPEFAQHEQNFKELRVLLLNNHKGFGIERVTYELNDGMPCQSSFLEGEYVTEIKELLPALENASKHADAKQWPVDRHVAGFVTARYERDLRPQLTAMNEGGPERNALGMLSLLAVLQWRLGPEALFGLTSWLGGLVAPVINSYHSRERRKRLEREIPRVVRKGSLPELYNLLDNAEERGSDGEGFERAKADYAEARRQVAALESGQATRDENAIRVGHQTAAMVSVGIGLLTIVILMLVQIL